MTRGAVVAAMAALLLGLAGCDQPPPQSPLGAPSGQASIAGARLDRIVFPPGTAPVVAAAGETRRVRSLIDVHHPMRYGAFVWNDAGVPPGTTWLRIDLHSQILSVFRGGDEIGTSVILYGTDGKPTPRGAFRILAMLRDHRSSLYDAVMPYTLRITGDGVSIHGSNVREHAATHGCVGVPLAFAQRLFAAAHVGDSVLIL